LLTGLLAGVPAGTAAAQSTLSSASFVETWSAGPFADTGQPIAESSPMVADLDGQPSVVVGDRTGYLYAYHLSDGSVVTGWPVFDGGAPIDSTPSVAPLNGSALDSVFVGAGNAQFPGVGGYEAYGPQGQLLWHTNVTDPTTDPHPVYGVQASLTLASMGGGMSVFAGSLDQEAYALTATSGSVDWPFFTADSVFSTAAAGDLYGDGQDELVVGGASTAGLAMGESYPQGGHVRIINAQGTLLYDYDTNQEVDSSPAVGGFLAGGATGIAIGTGSYWPNASDTDTLKAFTTRLALVWSQKLDGKTSSSPALADVQGQGLDVVEGTDTGTSGSVWVMNGATGAPIWEEGVTGRVIGSVVAADLTGDGYQDLLVPTTHGVEVLDGQNGAEVTVLRPDLGFQNAPLVTDEPNGTIGITIAGYDGLNEGVITHYEIPASNGALAVGPGSWPMFHHDQTLSGLSTPLPDVGTVAPTGLTAQGGNGQVSLSWVAPSGGGAAATGYNVYAGTAPGHESGTPINGTTPVTGTNYAATGLSNGTRYYFEITAFNPSGEGSPSGEASATPMAGPPGAPGLAATAGDSQVSLSWTAPTSNGGSALTGYSVYESTVAGAQGPRVLTGTAGTAYTANGLVNGTTYYFEVTASNSVGEGPASAQVPAMPSSSPTPASTTSTTAPTTSSSSTTTSSAPPSTTSPAGAPPAGLTLTPGPVPVQTSLPPPGPMQTPTPTSSASPGRPTRLGAVPGNTEVSLSWLAPSPGSGPTPTAYDVYVSTRQGVKGTEAATTPGTTYAVTGLTNGTTYYFTVSAASATGAGIASVQVAATPRRPPIAPGYRLATSGGQVFALGQATSSPAPPTSRAAGIVSTPDGRGYWLALQDGGVVAAGDAHLYGSLAGRHLASPVTSLAASPDGRGYWLTTATGQVFAFGDAGTYPASTGGRPNGPVVGVATTADGRGYWLVSSRGSIAAFGDAHIYGSLTAAPVQPRVVGIAATGDGRGYWVVTSDGAVFAFGDAHFYGSLGARRLDGPVVAIAATPNGRGYWLAASDGGVFCFGDAPFFGPANLEKLHQKVVGITS
jgi:hypothetical protein